jgi:hypothetical protein
VVAGGSEPRAGGILRLRVPDARWFCRREPEPRPAARWDAELGEYVLDWEEIRESADPHSLALEFARSAFRHACEVCEWDPALAATAEGVPPPIR